MVVLCSLACFDIDSEHGSWYSDELCNLDLAVEKLSATCPILSVTCVLT